MSDQRTTYFRVRVGVLLLIAVLLALGSFWVLDVMRKSMEEVTPLSKRTEPDYYVEQFNFVRMTKTGQVQYHISGERMTHNPQDDTYEITQPVIKSLSDNYPPVTIRAKRAVADPNTSQVQLFNDVQMERPASATAKRLHMVSDYLLVLTDEEIMKTHRPVELLVGNSTLKGVGMFTNHATREFRLLDQVQTLFPPRSAS